MSQTSGSPCDSALTFWAITITVLPQWAIITTLIIVVLVAFHHSLRAAKIYDNCTKNNAKYKYYVEIRTGDTSYSYNRRRTTLYIDMFDDNQTTLARVAVPGHVIFGKKDAPISAIDDEKYFELRVTRFWLYRVTRLRKVSTIRLTHTCTEPEARIMVYGVEIRTSEPATSKLFFPVMNNISAYGSVNKPNASFDLESAGSISLMGGIQAEGAPICSQISWADIIILFYFMTGLIFLFSTLNTPEKSFIEIASCLAKGAFVGAISYAITLIIGLILIYFVKQNYANRIGVGAWSFIYYASCTFIVLCATAIWIYTTISAYKNLCPRFYTFWVLAIITALLECALLAFINSLISWTISLYTARSGEQYMLPDDYMSANQSQPEPPSRRTPINKLLNSPTSPQIWGNVPLQMILPTGTYVPQNVYNQMMLGSVSAPTNYKTAQGYANYQTVDTHHHQQQQQQLPQPGTQQADLQGATQGNLFQVTQKTTNSASPNSGGNGILTGTNQVNLHGIKPTRRIGSNDSTGSTYYHQVMKNKGDIKSISQYGTLMKHTKTARQNNK